MASSDFLDLPAELRNETYKLVLSQSSRPLQTPWDDGKACKTILYLLLANRQVYSEFSSLLRSEPAENLCLHFDDGRSFNDFLKSTLLLHPQLNVARFRLRVTAPNKRYLDIVAHKHSFNTIIRLLWLPLGLGFLGMIGSTPVDSRKQLHKPHLFPKCPIWDAAVRAGERGHVKYWRFEHSVLPNDLKWTSYAWDTWMIEDNETNTLRGEKAGFDVALGRKVRSECVVVEGSIANAVKARMPDIISL